jgi:hybrid cluster-associated redox disulfide protein
MRGLLIYPDMKVDEIMRKWSGSGAVTPRYRMLCVGCPIGPFHTVVRGA